MEPINTFLGKVIHGDCIDVMQTMPSESVDLIVTDPPYFSNSKEHANSDAWLQPAFREIYRILKPNSYCVSLFGWTWINRFMVGWTQNGFNPVSCLMWSKMYHSKKDGVTSKLERGYLFVKGNPPRLWSPVSGHLPWKYTSTKLYSDQKPALALKPVIEAFCKPGGIVCDPFAGAGITGIAAQQCGRLYILIEKEKRQ